jgi:hypothetical protein
MIILGEHSGERSPTDGTGGTIMRLDPNRRALGLILGLTLVGAGIGLRAGEVPSDKALDQKGLKRAGAVLVLQAESEVHAKAEEVRRLSAQRSHAVAQQRATLSEKEYQDTIKELTAEVNQIRSEINAATQNMNRIPKRRGYPVNNILAEQYQELSYYRSQLQMEADQRTAFLTQLKSRPFDPMDRIKADAEARNREEAMHQGAQDLRKLVDGVHAKYASLAQDPGVKKWLDTPEGPAGVKPRLGPSRAFLQDEKLLERVERVSAADEPGDQAPKASRKGRRTIKARRAAGSGNAVSPF